MLPQLAGLGRSPTAREFAIDGLEEARAYLAHPVLGDRLRTCARVLADLPVHDPVQVLGEVDAVKLRSSMTLFAAAHPAERSFREVLDVFFDGEPDPRTLDLLARDTAPRDGQDVPPRRQPG